MTNIKTSIKMKTRKSFVFAMLFLFFALSSNSVIYGEGISSTNRNRNLNSMSTKDTVWSVLIANSVIHKYPHYAAYDTTKIGWNYELGVILYAFWNVWQKTKDVKYLNYIKNNINYFVTKDGKIKTYHFDKFRLDDICPGRILLDLYKETGNNKYKEAAELLRKQLTEQPRTPEGGFWHKKIYPEQMWLDGLYMAEPFYAQYAKMFNQPKDYDDIAKQFILMAKHGKDPKTGLFYHGWDWSKKQKWANSKTGDSPSFWGRSIGWYLMGLVDVLDNFPANKPERSKLIDIFKNLCNSLLKYQDRKSHLWYLILDKPKKKGNYLESSASAMFMYVFAKGALKGYLSREYLSVGEQIFNGLLKKSVKRDEEGYLHLYNTISGAGLGGHPYRDGTFEYYSSESKRVDDFKGLGPFILGAIELEKAGLIK